MSTSPPPKKHTQQLYCKDSAAVATNNFHAGTLSLLFAVATMTFAQLVYIYGSFICAGLFGGICFLAASVALYFHVQVPPKNQKCLDGCMCVCLPVCCKGQAQSAKLRGPSPSALS